jgi:LysM repeat protein
MNNPNPFVPKGSILEQQSKRRSRLKLGVFCVLAVGIAGLAAMLIQGCKREETENNPPDMSQNQPPVDTNSYASTDTNVPPMEASNPPVAPVPPAPTAVTPPPMPTPPAPAPAPSESEYVVVKGDTLAKIAKSNGVTLKALEDSNSGVSPTRLKVGQKLVIPAGASTTGATTAAETASGISAGGEQVYVVKSGDTLTRIAHRNGVTVKAIMAENNLTTTHIKVGQKLNIPAKPEAAPTDVNTPPTTATPAAAPTAEPMPSVPAPTPPPAPANGTAQ